MRVRFTRCLSPAVMLAFSWLLAGNAVAADDWSTRFAGVRLLHRTVASPSQDIHVLEVDLTRPGVSLRATASDQRRRGPTSYAKLVGAQIAVNGDFFSYEDYSTRGLAVGASRRWPNSVDGPNWAAFAFGVDNRVELAPLADRVTFDDSWMRGVVGGWPILLSAGNVNSFESAGEHCSARHPRTAVGFSEDKKTLYIAVVDGRRTEAVGMTCLELATLMKDVGAHRALSLDGGGSSAMFVQGLGTVNEPSDGAERSVANHLAVFAEPAGSLARLEGAVLVKGSTQPIVGAEVKVKGEGTDLSGANGRYAFLLVPKTYEVIVKAKGYQTLTASVNLPAGETKTRDFSLTPSVSTADADADGVLDPVDNCPNDANPGQSDTDRDGLGDVCDPDKDADGVPDGDDNCPGVANPNQENADVDAKGDACDTDDDGDGVLDDTDNCPRVANADQADANGNGLGDVCDVDGDGDGILDGDDSCPDLANADQADRDQDGIGDACDEDLDGDSVPAGEDNCIDVANPDQADSDGDGSGDACTFSIAPIRKSSGCSAGGAALLPLALLLTAGISRRRSIR